MTQKKYLSHKQITFLKKSLKYVFVLLFEYTKYFTSRKYLITSSTQKLFQVFLIGNYIHNMFWEKGSLKANLCSFNLHRISRKMCVNRRRVSILLALVVVVFLVLVPFVVSFNFRYAAAAAAAAFGLLS